MADPAHPEHRAEVLVVSTLDPYIEATDHLDRDDRDRFDSYLIGWLLTAVGDEAAAQAVKAALAHIKASS